MSRQLTRRDAEVESDWIQLVFDTYHDHAGRTILQVNPSGVKYDAGQASPSADPSWDPVWEVETRVDSLGWTAEMRIPWSQLRFTSATEQTWGVQIWRYVQRLNEMSMWSFWGKQEPGGPQRFGHLSGMRIEKRPRGLEIMPYALARASYVTPTQPGSPFQDEQKYDTRIGADVRALLGSNLTLSATINPDFGQVEQDPAVVNLSAFESFFAEKRPFFVEGSGLLSFGGFSCFTCSNVSSMSLFYSRRIGRSPQGQLPDGYDYGYTPANTRLLAAAKLTGRTSGGWQIGALEAVTAREVGRMRNLDGTGEEVTVEPFSNYMMGRVKRITHGGSRTWGLIATSVYRSFGDGDDGAAHADSRARRGGGRGLVAHLEEPDVPADGERGAEQRERRLAGHPPPAALQRPLLSAPGPREREQRLVQRRVRHGRHLAARLWRIRAAQQGQRAVAVGDVGELPQPGVRGERHGVPEHRRLRVDARQRGAPVHHAGKLVPQHLALRRRRSSS